MTAFLCLACCFNQKRYFALVFSRCLVVLPSPLSHALSLSLMFFFLAIRTGLTFMYNDVSDLSFFLYD